LETPPSVCCFARLRCTAKGL